MKQSKTAHSISMVNVYSTEINFIITHCLSSHRTAQKNTCQKYHVFYIGSNYFGSLFPQVLPHHTEQLIMEPCPGGTQKQHTAIRFSCQGQRSLSNTPTYTGLEEPNKID